MIVTAPSDTLSSATWIDLLQPTDEEAARVNVATGLRVPTENQISEIESSSRLGFENGAYYLSAPLVAPREDGEHALVPVGFVLSSRVLLTVRFSPLASIDDARSQLGSSQRTAEDRRVVEQHAPAAVDLDVEIAWRGQPGHARIGAPCRTAWLSGRTAAICSPEIKTACPPTIDRPSNKRSGASQCSAGGWDRLRSLLSVFSQRISNRPLQAFAREHRRPAHAACVAMLSDRDDRRAQAA